MRKKREAHVYSIVTDMGNGGDFCSSCWYDLTYMAEERLDRMEESLNKFMYACGLGPKPEIRAKKPEDHIDLSYCPDCKRGLRW